ncbi:MAG: Ig-like domain-containing protein [candidate division WOR-3 bacterium]|nr:Ig-like domain-containing protein [candidate division WOR-3 bacterium]
MIGNLFKKFLTLLLIVIIFHTFCRSRDREPPVVELLSPKSPQVCNICTISAVASDNEQVSKIEIYINNQLVYSVEDSVCNFEWNTRNYPDNSIHKIFARALDLEENEGFSDTIAVTIFNNLDNTEIFIWLFDKLDKFYDPTIGDSVDCGYWLERTLTFHGYSYDILTFLPPDLTSYKIGFVTLGWERC